MRIPAFPNLLPPAADRPRVAFALLIGTAGGLLAQASGLPLPWMLGPMLACAVAAFSGLPVEGPYTFRPVVIPVIGVMLGASFSPDLLNRLWAWAGTFALLPAFLLVAGFASWTFYRRIGGYDARTAFFCAAPGGLNEMILLGEEVGADERRIALAHAVRVFVVIAVIAIAFALLAGTTTAGLSRATTGILDLGPLDAMALLACAVLGTPLARAVRLPAPGLFGPMALSAALHMAGAVTVPPPNLAVVLAQLVIGTILGCSFAGASLKDTGRDMLLGVGAALILVAVALLFAGLVAAMTTVPWSQAMLAYAPGGLTEMSLLALAKEQDVAYVATAHVARILLVILAVRPIFMALEGRMG